MSLVDMSVYPQKESHPENDEILERKEKYYVYKNKKRREKVYMQQIVNCFDFVRFAGKECLRSGRENVLNKIPKKKESSCFLDF